MSVHTTVDTPVGTLTVVGAEAGLVGLSFDEHRHLPDPTGFGPLKRFLLGLEADQPSGPESGRLF